MYRLHGKILDVARTCVHFLIFVSLGLLTAIPGPTLLDLEQLTGVDSNKIGFIFTARSAGYLAGSVISGIVLDAVSVNSGELTLIVFCFLIGLGAVGIPWCYNLYCLLAIFMLVGFAMGYANTGINAFCLRIWKNKSGPILQGLHFAYGVGGFIAPLLTTAFPNHDISTDASEIIFEKNATIELSSEHSAVNTSIEEFSVTKSVIALNNPIVVLYCGMGIFAIYISCIFVLVHCLASTENVNDSSDVSTTKNLKVPGLKFTYAVVFFAAIQAGLMSGVEVSFTQMLTSYVVKGTHNLSKSVGSYMTSAYWASFTLTRALSILVAIKVNCIKLLIFDLSVATAAILILLIFGSWSTAPIWVGVCLLGVGVASFFPSLLSWIENYIIINNKITSLFPIVSCIIEMTAPMTINVYLKSRQTVLFEFILGAIILCIVSFIILSQIVKRKGVKYVEQDPAEI